MPMDPANLDGVGEQLAQLYSDAEVQLITRIATALGKGLTAPDWAVRQLVEINTIAIQARGLLYELEPQVTAAIQSAIAEAAAIGTETADDDIADIPGRAAAVPAAAVDTAAATALAAETVQAVTDTHRGILRAVEDTHRRIVSEVASRTVTGVANRREVTQAALNKFADEGIGVFTDRAGRNWKIDTYTEMAVRTATLRAMRTGHQDRLTQRGYDLVVVSSHPAPAPVCKPYEGKILSLSGSTPRGPRQFESARTGEPVRETVFASLDEAQRNGLGHPNCRHRWNLLVPGVDRPTVTHEDGDEAYENGQELRRLERDVRKWKRREAVALTPAEKARAASKVREKQAAIRTHVDATGVRRLRHREQMRTGRPGRANDSTRVRPVDPKPDTTTPNVRAAAKLADDQQAWLAAEAAYEATRPISRATRDTIAKARQSMPRGQTDWAVLRPTKADANGNILPSDALLGHLATVTTTGRAVRADVARRLDADPTVVELRATRNQAELERIGFAKQSRYLDAMRAGDRRDTANRQLATRESAAIHEALSDARPFGGHQQQVRVLSSASVQAPSAAIGRQLGVAPTDAVDLLREAERFYPTEWLRKADARGELTLAQTDRAFFAGGATNGDDLIGISNRGAQLDVKGAHTDTETEIMIHEVGHRMEQVVPGLMPMEFALARRRATTNGVLDDLVDMGGGEMSYEDKWRLAYTGRSYAQSGDTRPDRIPHEVFQVGTQDLFGRGVRKYGDDELQDFTMGVLVLL